MRTIVKRTEPATLTTHRNTSQCDYSNYADKDTLRSALVAEQRGLCCYCMCRIEDESSAMKIEYWRSRTTYPGEQLAYRNLLAACPGGEGQPLQLQHCDTRKGDRDLLWNPADPERRIEERIGYALDGAIWSNDRAFDRQLNDVLNLNVSRIRNERKGSLDGVLDWLSAQRRPVPTQRLEREVERLNSPEQLAPYVQVAVWWLERELRKRARKSE